MKNLKFQSVFDIIGPVMVGPLAILLERFELEKLFQPFLVRLQQKLNFNFLILLLKPIGVMGQTWPL